MVDNAVNYQKVPRILLIDDDLIFGQIFTEFSRQKYSCPVTFVPSVNKIEQLVESEFDLAIVDFDLGEITGAQLSRFIHLNWGKIPILLVSQYRQVAGWQRNEAITYFISKEEGLDKILDKAIEMVQPNT